MTKKLYIGIVRDHSSSMGSLRKQAAKDYNQNVESIRTNAIREGIDTVVSVVECSTQAQMVVMNSSVAALNLLDQYHCNGMTALFDAVGMLISSFQLVPDLHNQDVSFLIMVITDGEENTSRHWTASRIQHEINRLQKTDRWSFVFRVPRGYSRTLTNFGVFEGNIVEWDQTSQGFEHVTQVTSSAYDNYYSGLSRGVGATKKFFTNIDTQAIKQDLKKLDDVSREVHVVDVSKQAPIKDFIENKFKQPYVKGQAFYELNKTEKVQPQKQLVIRDKKNGKVYAGYQARSALGLPHSEHIKLTPGYHANYDIFVQSTSVNRILYPGSKVLFWPTKS